MLIVWIIKVLWNIILEFGDDKFYQFLHSSSYKLIVFYGRSLSASDTQTVICTTNMNIGFNKSILYVTLRPLIDFLVSLYRCLYLSCLNELVCEWYSTFGAQNPQHLKLCEWIWEYVPHQRIHLEIVHILQLPYCTFSVNWVKKSENKKKCYLSFWNML